MYPLPNQILGLWKAVIRAPLTFPKGDARVHSGILAPRVAQGGMRKIPEPNTHYCRLLLLLNRREVSYVSRPGGFVYV